MESRLKDTPPAKLRWEKTVSEGKVKWVQRAATEEEVMVKRRVLLHEMYQKDPDYFPQAFDSSSEESLTSVPGSNKSEDQEFLQELRRKSPELFHQICDSSSGKSSPSGSGSSESADLELLDLQAILRSRHRHATQQRLGII